MLRIRALIPALLRHADGYIDLSKDVITEWKTQCAGRLLAATIGVIFSVAAVVFASVWGLMAAWDLPARNWICAGICALLVIIAALALAAAARTPAPGPFRSELRSELEHDRELLRQAQQQFDGRRG